MERETGKARRCLESQLRFLSKNKKQEKWSTVEIAWGVDQSVGYCIGQGTGIRNFWGVLYFLTSLLFSHQIFKFNCGNNSQVCGNRSLEALRCYETRL